MFETLSRKRIVAGAAAAGLQLLIGYALVTGLTVRFSAKLNDAIAVFVVPPEAPPPRVRIVPPKVHSRKSQGAAAPRNLRSKAAAIVAPPAVIVLPDPPPVLAALTSGLGTAGFAGASDLTGPGTGSGGQGNGTGSGGSGDGEGGGDEIPLRKIKGRIGGRDYPEGLREAGIGGTVYVRFVVAVSGRVERCEITRSSGSHELDETTCKLIIERFRYKPTRDRFGKLVPDIVVGEQVWVAGERH